VVRAAGTAISFDRVAEGLAAVRDRIARAGGASDVVVLPVTKGFGPDAIEAAVAAGCERIGENYAQELWPSCPRPAAAPEVHHRPAQCAGADVGRRRRRLADGRSSGSRRRVGARRPAQVMVQVNVTDEPQKAGARSADARPSSPRPATRAWVDGLMTIGRAGHQGSRRLPRAARWPTASGPPLLDGDERGSGVAVSEGATMAGGHRCSGTVHPL
jgi:uncharacterized pyridoxal phosphate-containing UPF0001 family protein